MSRTLDTLDNHTVKMIFSNLGFQKGGNCQGRSSSPFRIMQIVNFDSPYRRRDDLVENALMARWHSWVRLADFFGFIYKVVTRQKL